MKIKKIIVISFIISTLLLQTTPSFAIWETSTLINPMTEKKTAYAYSNWTYPVTQMAWPYNDIKAILTIGYDGIDQWVYIAFAKMPNIQNKQQLLIKWDNDIKNIKKVSFLHTSGEKALHFCNDNIIIKKISESNTLMVGMKWYGHGTIYFNFSLAGSATAINKMKL